MAHGHIRFHDLQPSTYDGIRAGYFDAAAGKNRVRGEYRADHVGSLLRPPDLLEARNAGDPAKQRELEVEHILRALAKQKELGFQHTSRNSDRLQIQSHLP